MNLSNSFRTKLIGALVALLALFGATALIVGTGASPAMAQEATLPVGGMVTATEVTGIYEGMDTASMLMAQIPPGEKAQVMAGPFGDGWYWVEYGGAKGYAHGRTLAPPATPTPVPPTKTVVPTKTLVPTKTPIPTKTATPTKTAIPTATAVPDQGYGNLWLGEMNAAATVRSGPGTDTKAVKGWWVGRRVIMYETVKNKKGETWYRVSDAPEASMWVRSDLVRKLAPVEYQGAKYKGKWINVDLSQQIVIAYIDGTPVKVALTSTGTARTPTEQGVQRVLTRVTAQRMRGGTPGIDYYDLANVPNVLYFNNTGEALHGAYWHDNFGYTRSHGCVNLSIPISKWFFDWTPIGTIVWVHN